MAATNKCLARNNKSRAGFRRQIKRPAAQRIPLALPTGGVPLRDLGAAGLSPALWRAEAGHELAPSRPVFFALPAYRSRDVPGYHLRMHPEIQAETAGSPAARRAPA
jgi:hypothetical protein